VTAICLASSTIGKERPVAPSYASDSWSQITGSRARTRKRRQYRSTAGRWLGARGPLFPHDVVVGVERTTGSDMKVREHA
jgi:hypothetical protein